jgi:pyrroloquinoline quinone biosynthesis protein B
MEVVVLGSAAGGGFPQWNCNAPTSRRAREGALRARTQASVAVSADGESWVMLNASPDARQQLLQTRCLWPREAPRHSPVQAVVLTSAEVDHVAGLLSMRESQPFVLWGTERVLGLLKENPIFEALNPDYVERRAFALNRPVEIAPETKGEHGGRGLTMTAFAVPGKVPLFLESRDPQNLAGTAEDTIGLEISSGRRSFHFVPGCARMTPELAARLDGSDLVFFDGTLWSDDELVRLGISQKTGQRMGHMSINGGSGTLSEFDRLDVRRKIFIHVNTTNPVLDEDSPEHAEAAAHGWEVAEDGMRISL